MKKFDLEWFNGLFGMIKSKVFPNYGFWISVIILAITFGCATKESRPSKMEGYQLKWNDEFNVDGVPEEKNWNYELGFVRNIENQWYQKENAYCKKGYLIIEAKKESRINPNFVSYDHKDWRKNRDSIRVTSSCLITKGKHEWKYGRFEMRAKIPVAKGMWPAFWTLGVKGDWPANGEIDIMEYYRGKILANVAWKSNAGTTAWDSKTALLEDFKNDSWANEFHIWRMDWDENSIKLYVDNQLLNETDLKDTFNSVNQTIIPFQQPHYLLVNLAVGGTEGGETADNSFPSKYVIDYVRVYQKK
ncbi:MULTISPECIES: glycoside hydrolase family 16 protein [unclassified Flavobacterium]|jgi:beta-glucanase (GH16 family)|uniref:glycoside hydrolase family 16 protein n=1 Tax=unclassified Flavobacterium TaxID=196869 RepID=UPI0025C290AE|nr:MULTISPECIES: glycoside hydrolase family 16 protein [unclassified Flavobacterium]